MVPQEIDTKILVGKTNVVGLIEKLRIDGRMILKCFIQENECSYG
jgi:hypothetical protein